MDTIATGHYARVQLDPDGSESLITVGGVGPFNCWIGSHTGARLMRAADPHKDQTYFLSQVPQVP